MKFSRSSLALILVAAASPSVARGLTCTPAFPSLPDDRLVPASWALSAATDAEIRIPVEAPLDGTTLTATSARVWTTRTGAVPGTWSIDGGWLTFTRATGAWVPADQVFVQTTLDLRLASGDVACPWTTTFMVGATWGEGSMAEAYQTVQSVGTSPYDVVAADLDGDGLQDLVLPDLGEPRLQLIFNTGCPLVPKDWDLQEQMCVSWSNRRAVVDLRDHTADAQLLARFVLPVDLDLDGDVDLVAATGTDATGESADSIAVLLNDGAGDLQDLALVVAGQGSRSADAADLNGDGWPDLAVVNEDSNDLQVLLADSAAPGTFLDEQPDPVDLGESPRWVRLVDLDGDGDLDAIASQLDTSISAGDAAGGWLHLLTNDGEGTLTQAEGLADGGIVALPAANGVPCWAHNLELVDVDADGQAEVILPTHNCGVVLLWDQTEGFTEVNLHAGDQLWRPGVADLDRDGAADILVSNDDVGGLFYLRGSTSWQKDVDFSAPESRGQGVAIADLDGDGALDAAVVGAESVDGTQVGVVNILVNAVDLDRDGQTTAEGDCDDYDPLTWTGAPEEGDTGEDDGYRDVDNDCDDEVDEDTRWRDDDGDGWSEVDSSPDCDDAETAAYPGAPERLDGADNDCDGLPDEFAYAPSCLCSGGGATGTWPALLLLALAVGRRRRGLAGLALGALALGPGPARAEGGAGGKRVAVIVGVTDYDGDLVDLRWAGDDAEAMAATLADPALGGFDRVVLLESGGAVRPTRAGLLDTVRREGARLRPNDTLLVYFSGHALIAYDQEGTPQHWLVPSGANLQNLVSSGVTVEELSALMDSFDAERKLLIIDGCYAALEQAPVLKKGGDLPADMRHGWYSVRMLAAGKDFNAVEDNQLEHGVYTYYLLEALRDPRGPADVDRDGGVTAYEAHGYAAPRTLARTDQRQEPALELRSGGSPDMVLSGLRGGAPVNSSIGTWKQGQYRGLTITAAPVAAPDRVVEAPVVAGLSLEPGRYQIALRSSDGEPLHTITAQLEPGLTRVEDLFGAPTRGHTLVSAATGASGSIPLGWDWPTLPAVAATAGVAVERFGAGLGAVRIGLALRVGPPPEPQGAPTVPWSETLDLEASPMLSLGRWRTALNVGPSAHLSLLTGAYQTTPGWTLGPGLHLGLERRVAETWFAGFALQGAGFAMGDLNGGDRPLYVSWSAALTVARAYRP